MLSIGESSDLKAERNRREKLVQLPRFADEVIRDSLWRARVRQSGSVEGAGIRVWRLRQALNLLLVGLRLWMSVRAPCSECRGRYISFWHQTFSCPLFLLLKKYVIFVADTFLKIIAKYLRKFWDIHKKLKEMVGGNTLLYPRPPPPHFLYVFVSERNFFSYLSVCQLKLKEKV